MPETLKINVADVVRVSESIGVGVSKRKRRLLEKVVRLWPDLEIKGLDINTGLFGLIPHATITLRYELRK